MKENPRWLAVQAQDVLNELKDNQYLLEAVEWAIDEAYFDADDDTREKLTKISTVLRAYDNDRVTDSLKKAITLLDEVRT